MQNTTLILLAAGSATRFGLPTKKQWLYQGDKPLWLWVAESFTQEFDFVKIVIVGASSEIDYMKNFSSKYFFVSGGNSRQESLSNALKEVDSEWVLVNDVARCCIDKDMIERIFKNKEQADVVVPALKVVDTVYLDSNPVNRDAIKLIQTPQLSRSSMLKRALESNYEFTDESSAIQAIGGRVVFVDGSPNAHKLTTPQDISKIPCLKPPSNRSFTGFGIDTHAFEDNKPMYLCGVEIGVDYGFKAHSDGDVAIHALIDALLGAVGLGDIGKHFPDNDNRYKGIDSKELLKSILKMINGVGFEIWHIDMTIVAQKPRLKEYKEIMRESLSNIMNLGKAHINIKATTSEKLGFIGRKEGVTVHCVATVGYFDYRRVV